MFAHNLSTRETKEKAFHKLANSVRNPETYCQNIGRKMNFLVETCLGDILHTNCLVPPKKNKENFND